jgi:CspA family cold shock protein
MLRGRITFFNDSRGYGFIESEEAPQRETGNGLYVHHSQIDAKGYRTLREGDRVMFEVRDGSRGPEAVNVRRVG